MTLALVVAVVLHALPWPGPSSAAVAASDGGVLTVLDPNLQLEMSGAHWNDETRTLWVTAGGSSGVGTWALQYDASAGAFSVLEFWAVPRDEGITQASLTPVAPGQHRIYILRETTAQIIQALMTVSVAGNGTSAIERSWTISEALPNGNAGAEGLCFVPDGWLMKSGFVDGAGAPWTGSQGGLGGLMFVAHQNGGHLFAIDLSADGSNRFAGRSYRVVGVYRTALTESSGLEFDRSIGRLYISHNTAGNRLEVSDLTSSASSGGGPATRTLTSLALFDSPALSNPEGFAMTPFLEADGGVRTQGWAFFTSDAEAGEPVLNKQRSVLWYRGFSPAVGTGLVLRKVEGDAQTGVVGRALPVAPRVEARDSCGYPVAGSLITFAPSTTGVVQRAADTTPGDGTASSGAWTLGASPGTQSLTAIASGVAQTVFTATALDVDAGLSDAGNTDAGGTDAGGTDAGGTDAGGTGATRDAGDADDGGAGLDGGDADAGPRDAGSPPTELPSGSPPGCGCSSAAEAAFALVTLTWARRRRVTVRP